MVSPREQARPMSVLRPEFPDHSSPFSREQERQRKEAAILSAAARRFDAEGVHATRLEDIAADLGLTKTGISYYFSSKEELAGEVYRASAQALADAVRQAREETGSAAQRIRTLFRAFADQMRAVSEGRRPHLAAINDLDALGSELQAGIAADLSGCISDVNGMIIAWAGESGAPLGRPEPATFFVFGLLDWMGSWPSHKRDWNIDTAADTLFAILTDGLKTEAGWEPAPLQAGTPDVGVPQVFDREARNRMKREAFLKAGTRFFNKKGFGGVALSEIAASLGVTRGAFYYHIPDKEQLLEQCLERSFTTVEQALDRAEAGGRSGLAVIEHTVRDLIYQQASGVTPLLRPSLSAALAEPRQRRHAARLRNIARRFGDALEHAVSEGEARPVDIQVAERILTHSVFLNGGYTIAAANSFTDWRISEDPLTATIDYVYILMRGLGAET